MYYEPHYEAWYVDNLNNNLLIPKTCWYETNQNENKNILFKEASKAISNHQINRTN